MTAVIPDPGESTLPRMLTRLTEKASGESRIDGRDVPAADDAELRRPRNPGNESTPATTPRQGVRRGPPPGGERR